MKYLLTLFLPLMLLVTACEKTEYVVPNRTVLVDLAARDWRSVDNRATYEALIDLPEYDRYTNQQGAILVYASFDGGRNYEQIPQVYEGISYSYVVTEGSLLIEMRSLDGGVILAPRVSTRVKIVLIDSSSY